MSAEPTSPSQAYAPELSRRFGLFVATLRTCLGRAWKPQLNPIGIPLLNRISRILRRFTDLMGRLAAGRLRSRRFPHTGGAPHPENLQRGNPLPTREGWLLIALDGDLAYWVAGCAEQLERLLAEPATAELLATAPAAERILRPLRRMLGCGPFDLNRPRPPRSRKPAPKRARPPAPTRPYKCRLPRIRNTMSRGHAWYHLFHPPKEPA